MTQNPLVKLQEAGVSVWLDYLSRDLIESGALQKLVDEDGLRGETSNPTIFQKAISEGKQYQAVVAELTGQGKSAEEICWELMIRDVRSACDLFAPIYEKSGGKDGFVSLELDPRLAESADHALAQGRDLWARVGRPNLMLKVPATEASLPVIEALLHDGLNVNVTLLFSAQRYEEVMQVFFRALERRKAEGLPLERVASVASFFVSRVDSEADKRFDAVVKADATKAAAADALRGRIAVANARLAYEKYLEHFGTERWKALAAAGAQVQRPLWASTSTKNPRYQDTLYVADLIGPDCVNTMPEETVVAFRDHGVVAQTLTPETLADANRVLRDLAGLGISLDDITDVLMTEGVQKFIDSFEALLATVSKAREAALVQA